MYRRRVDAAALVRLRAERGLTRTALHKRSGVSLSMLKYIEAGQKQPSDVLAVKIAKALKVKVEAFSVPDPTRRTAGPGRAQVAKAS